jgi:hypothetical protein
VEGEALLLLFQPLPVATGVLQGGYLLVQGQQGGAHSC